MINPQPSSPAPTHTQIEAGELFCAGNDDSKSQLRLFSPKLLEGGFSFVASDYGASRTTFKVACRQGLVPGSIVRRVLLVLIIATVGGLLLRLPAYNPSPTQHRSIILAKTRYTSPSGMVSHATSNLGDREIDIASDALPVVATLRERLDVWRKAPGGKGEIEGEVEHGGYFLWALLTFRKRWAIPDRWVGATGLPAGTVSRDFCSHTMLQHDAWENLFLFNTNFSNKFLLILVGAIVGVELSSFLCLTLGLLRLFLPVTMSLRIDQWTTACQGWAIWIVRYWQMLQKIWLCEWLRGKEVLRPYIMVVSDQRFGKCSQLPKPIRFRLLMRSHSTDLTYIDPRPKERQEKDAAHQNTMTISTSSEAHEKESEEWVGVIDPTGTSHRLSWYNGNQMSIYLILKVKSTT
nr:hypothetical protein L203_00623 [Cryptococcus depauperatus CBS 7841]